MFKWVFIYRLDLCFLNSSLGIRLMDFDVHIMIVGAFKYVVVQFILFFMSKYFYLCPLFSVSLHLPLQFGFMYQGRECKMA